MSNLLYRRQFVIGPRFVDVAPGWNQLDIGDGLKLTAHPELDVEDVSHANKRLVAIGPMLDSITPEKTNREILTDLISTSDDIDSLLKATSPYGGRWLLIVTFGEKRYLFNDASGLRQVFYTDPDSTDALWLVSQPGLAASFLGLKLDEAAAAYIESYTFRQKTEYGWPGSATAFEGLTHLLPNHLLELDTVVARRFWPWAPLAPMSTDDASELISQRMGNLLKAAAIRYPLAIGLTAGIDSRVILASAKAVSGDILFVTVRQKNMPDDHMDLKIGAMLCKKYGLAYQAIKTKFSTSGDFSKLFKDNVFLSVDIYGPDAEAILDELGGNRVVITGSAAEIGRYAYGDDVPPEKYNGPMTGEELGKIVSNEETFVIKNYQTWLDGAKDRHNIKLMDLFEWEGSHGNWLPMTQAQFDVAWKEIITPYNCRDVIEAFLSVKEEDRVKPAYIIQKDIISRSWPELLDIPINPDAKIKQNDRTLAKRLIKRTVKLLNKLL